MSLVVGLRLWYRLTLLHDGAYRILVWKIGRCTGGSGRTCTLKYLTTACQKGALHYQALREPMTALAR